MNRILLFLCINIMGFSYSQNKKDEYKQLLDSAIIIKQENLAKQNSRFLINADNLIYPISNKLRNNFKSIDIYDKKNKAFLKKGFNVWKIIPLLNGNKLIINILDFTIFYKKNNFEFSNGGGSVIIFEYSCREEKWNLINETHSGI